MTKLFYKIGEVCEITDLKPSVLRFWEKEFKQLRPTKSGGGQRYYTPENIEFIKRLKSMLYEEKFTIEGAKLKLKEGDIDTSDSVATDNHQSSILDNSNLKKELQDILALLD